jgi:hypothetical protein
MGSWSLRQTGCAFIACQHIRVAVLAKARLAVGIEPGARADLDDTRSDAVAQHRPTEAGTPIVEYTDDIARLYLTLGRIIGVHHHGLTAFDLRGAAMGTVVEL